jgi:AsmA family protein
MDPAHRDGHTHQRNSLTLATGSSTPRKAWHVRAVVTLLGVGVALAAFLLLFDWTWLRPLIQHHVQQRSGRHIDFESMRVSLDSALQPTLHLRSVQLQNAPWAADRPLLRAGTFDITFGWASLRNDKWIITRMLLIDADIDLERQADGLRNWRLTRPDDRGPGRVRVLSVDAQRTRARFVHRGLNLELNLQTEALAEPAPTVADSALALTKLLRIQGQRGDTEFEGEAATSDVLTFFDTGEKFALRGAIRTGASRLDFDGVAHDLIALGGLDAKLHLSGTRPAELVRLFSGASLGALGNTLIKTDVSARVQKQGPQWSVTALKAKLGRSDVAGTANYRQEEGETPVASLQASLRSAHIDVAELGGFRRAPRAAAAGAATRSPRPTSATVDWEVASVSGLAPVPIDKLRLKASMLDDRLTVSPLTFNLASGGVSAVLQIDRTQSPTAVALDGTLSGLDLARLGSVPVSGELRMRVALRARGDSIAALSSSASGTLKAELLGATLPAKLDAQIGLDGGRWLRAFFDRDERVPITCSVLDLRVEEGQGQIRRLSFETGSVRVHGSGSVDLSHRSFDLMLFPRRKHDALLALDRAIRLQGTSAKVATTLVESAPTVSAEACVPGIGG